MHWVEKPGTSLEAMHRITDAGQQGAARHSRRAELRLAHRPGRGGRRGRRARTSPSCGSASIRDVDYDATVAKVQEVVDGYPGLYRDLLTYLRERIKEVLTGASATIVVRLYGPDLDRLQAHAAAVAQRDGADRRASST